MILMEIETGKEVIIEKIELNKELKLRLKELGVREKENIKILSKAISSFFVKIKNMRIILDKEIVKNIIVS